MVTLPSHTSHALQPLDVTCFKPFEIAFEKERHNNDQHELHWIRKVTFGRMGGQSINQAFSRKILFQGSKVQGFCHWNLKPWMREEGLVTYTQ